MAKLYVCNCTGQHVQVHYRLDFAVDENGRRVHQQAVPPRLRELQPRQQILFADFIHISQLEEVVKQLEKGCGAVHAREVKTAKAKGLVKLLWQEERPIPAPILKDVVEHNIGYLSAEGLERRRRLAIATDHQLNQVTHEVPEVGGPRLTELEFESDEEPDDEAQGTVAHGITINRNGRAAPKGRGRRAA